MNRNKLKIGIIGLGYWGPNFVRIIKDSHEAELVWCCDVREENLAHIRRTSPNTMLCTDYHEILNDPEVNAVIVVTPTATHYRIAKDCLLAGKHTFVEKPLARTSAECKELVNLAEAAGKILMVGHIFKFNAGFRKLSEVVKSRELGNTLYLHCRRTGLGPIREDVNVVYDLASHDIYMILHLMEKMPKSVVATGACYLKKNVHDVAFLTLKFDNGVLANIHVSWLDPFKTRMTTVVGDKKMAVFDDISTEPIRIFDKGVSYQERGVDYGEFKTLIRDGDILLPRVRGGEPLKEEFNHFVNCINNNETPSCSGEEGLKVALVLEAAQDSLLNGSKEVFIEIKEHVNWEK